MQARPSTRIAMLLSSCDAPVGLLPPTPAALEHRSLLEWDPVSEFEASGPQCPASRETTTEELLAWLRNGAFVRLDRELRAYQEAFEADVVCESRLWDVLEAFDEERDWMNAALDRWVKAMPEAYTACSARGQYWAALAWDRRGQKFAKNTSAEQFKAMREAFERAAVDLRRSIELEPQHLPPRADLIGMFAAIARREEAREVFDRGIEVEARSYELRRRYMNFLKPRWRGSYREMDALAREAQAHVAVHPRQRRLLGFAAAERARVARRDDDYETAVRDYTKALAYYRPKRWVKDRARAYTELGHYGHAVDDYAAYLELFPETSSVLRQRARAYRELGRYDEALRDLDRAVELEPSSYHNHAQRGFVLGKLERDSEAASAYERALEIEPDRTWALDALGRTLAWNLGRPEDALPYFKKVTELEPENARAWRLYGDALFDVGSPEARAALARYLEVADPADPEERESIAKVRAYLEEGIVPTPTER